MKTVEKYRISAQINHYGKMYKEWQPELFNATKAN